MHKAGAGAGGVSKLSTKPMSKNSANNPNRPRVKANMRTKADIKRISMYRQRPKRDENGRITYQELQSKELPNTRIQPDRRWFGNVHTVGQKQLETFQEELDKAQKNPFTVLLKYQKVPWGLLASSKQQEANPHLLDVETYDNTFGPKSLRKHAKVQYSDFSEYLSHAEAASTKYTEGSDRNIKAEREAKPERRAKMFDKGQSRRIWGELWKVVDSSDVIVEVLDARDPQGTRCSHLEKLVRRDMRHKHIVLLLNKCDLVPTWATAHWVRALSKEFPTLAFHASMTNPFGKGSLIQLLRQFSKFRSGEHQISVGFIGYPNVGKSSVINTLRSKKVCRVAPKAGETKVWQYVTLMKRVFLIDCPGVVYPSNDSETEIVLKGVVRIENLHEPTDHIPALLERVKPEYLQRAYNVPKWTDAMDFLAQLAQRTGKLLQKGEPDLDCVAKMLLNDWCRGKIPFFVPPPVQQQQPAAVKQEVQQQPAAKQEASQQQPASPVATEVKVEQQKKNEEQQRAAEEALAEVKKEDPDEKDEKEEAPLIKQDLPEGIRLVRQNLREVELTTDFTEADMLGPAGASSLLMGTTECGEEFYESDNESISSDDDDDEAEAGSEPVNWDEVLRSVENEGVTVLAEHHGGVNDAKVEPGKDKKRKHSASSSSDEEGGVSAEKADKEQEERPQKKRRVTVPIKKEKVSDEEEEEEGETKQEERKEQQRTKRGAEVIVEKKKRATAKTVKKEEEEKQEDRKVAPQPAKRRKPEQKSEQTSTEEQGATSTDVLFGGPLRLQARPVQVQVSEDDEDDLDEGEEEAEEEAKPKQKKQPKPSAKARQMREKLQQQRKGKPYESSGDEADSSKAVGQGDSAKKQPRMTTNKHKVGVHFYDFTNTKNKRVWRKGKQVSHSRRHQV
eukprot:TRINITY_DN5199_c0_g1_i1.p1 TRINITY_DN5199_c0_g1~~TRINITY_DN5199_c0_g1_i1.p1  ORF type:complete len:921 (-),score=296.33 TRINITY_DN5199_c0_g1_i1:50-2752(-)